jgi:hypothetical protein
MKGRNYRNGHDKEHKPEDVVLLSLEEAARWIGGPIGLDLKDAPGWLAAGQAQNYGPPVALMDKRGKPLYRRDDVDAWLGLFDPLDPINANELPNSQRQAYVASRKAVEACLSSLFEAKSALACEYASLLEILGPDLFAEFIETVGGPGSRIESTVKGAYDLIAAEQEGALLLVKFGVIRSA